MNIDGLPLSRKIKNHFWIIMAAVIYPVKSRPFVIGAYYGKTCPSRSDSLLLYFIGEMKNIQENDVIINGLKYPLNINAVSCDAPALAYVKCVIRYNGSFGCTKCNITGKSIQKRMTFSDLKFILRTDMSFRGKVQSGHHKGTSLFEQLKIDMVDQFPIDYMHCVCLGVVRKILRLIVKRQNTFKLSSDDLIQLTTALIKLRWCIPPEFVRKPRTILEYKDWKATEGRQFLLYTGILLMKVFSTDEVYVHFLSLSIAIRILCDPDLCITLNDYAHGLLNYFVGKFGYFYEDKNLTYNVHNLLHLASDVKRFGRLDAFSAFPFENEMQNIKNNIHPNDTCIQQLFNRIVEESKLLPLPSEYDAEKTVNSKSNNLQCVYVNEVKVDTEFTNNTLLLNDNSIVKVLKIQKCHNETYLTCQKYNSCESLFLKPCDSKYIGICVISEDNVGCPFNCPLSNVKRKMLKLPHIVNKKDFDIPVKKYSQYILIPLLH